MSLNGRNVASCLIVLLFVIFAILDVAAYACSDEIVRNSKEVFKMPGGGFAALWISRPINVK